MVPKPGGHQAPGFFVPQAIIGVSFPHLSNSVGLERGRLRRAGSAVTREVPRPRHRCLWGASSANRPRLLSTSGVSRRRHLERGCQRRYRSPGQPPSTTSWRAKNEYKLLNNRRAHSPENAPHKPGAGPGRGVRRPENGSGVTAAPGAPAYRVRPQRTREAAVSGAGAGAGRSRAVAVSGAGAGAGRSRAVAVSGAGAGAGRSRAVAVSGAGAGAGRSRAAAQPGSRAENRRRSWKMPARLPGCWLR